VTDPTVLTLVSVVETRATSRHLSERRNRCAPLATSPTPTGWYQLSSVRRATYLLDVTLPTPLHAEGMPLAAACCREPLAIVDALDAPCAEAPSRRVTATVVEGLASLADDDAAVSAGLGLPLWTKLAPLWLCRDIDVPASVYLCTLVRAQRSQAGLHLAPSFPTVLTTSSASLCTDAGAPRSAATRSSLVTVRTSPPAPRRAVGTRPTAASRLERDLSYAHLAVEARADTSRHPYSFSLPVGVWRDPRSSSPQQYRAQLQRTLVSRLHRDESHSLPRELLPLWLPSRAAALPRPPRLAR
jgi:hypothetical protein